MKLFTELRDYIDRLTQLAVDTGCRHDVKLANEIHREITLRLNQLEHGTLPAMTAKADELARMADDLTQRCQELREEVNNATPHGPYSRIFPGIASTTETP